MCLICAAALLFVASCSGDGVSTVVARTSTSLATEAPPVEQVGDAFQPRFVAAKCVTGVPRDERVRCGWLVVQANRAATKGPTIRLPVAIVSPETTAAPVDPVFFLAGGPGSSGLASTDAFLTTGLAGDRTVVLFDQRGTGAALPSLNCPEVEQESKAAFKSAGDPATEQAAVAAAFAKCHERLLADGIDLADYRSETSADDVEDLRKSLGYDQIDLYGLSYGSALALTVMRRHSGHLRSVSLDGVYPTTVSHGTGEVIRNVQRAIDALSAGCAASPSCSETAPNLRGSLKQVVERFDKQPHRGTAIDSLTGDNLVLQITGADILAGIVDALYDPATIKALPAAIIALAAGDESSINGFAALGLRRLIALSEGMAASTECADRATKSAPQTFASSIQGNSEMSTVAMIGDLASICAAWDVPPASSEFAQPLVSNVPTLLFSGAFDPVTPPAYAAVVARTLGRPYQVVFPAGGHGALFAIDCAVDVFGQFLRNPGEIPDASCAAIPASPWG